MRTRRRMPEVLRIAAVAALAVLVCASSLPASSSGPELRSEDPAAPAGDRSFALPPYFNDTLVTTIPSEPTSLDFLPDGRMIWTQKPGLLRILNGSVSTPLDISGKVRASGEGGLLGVAVDPDFPSRPYLYFHYTSSITGKVHIARYTVTDPGATFTVDPASELLWISYGWDNATNHNGGTVRFDAQKRLIASFGEDADQCGAQDLYTLKGKLLRMRVDPGADPTNPSTLVPPDNPWFSRTNMTQRLTWVEGLRNPFRFDVDKVTGDVLIGDVGAGAWEEVDVARGGENMGWPQREGNHTTANTCTKTPSNSTYTPPVYEVSHSAGWAAVIGMMVYRGKNYGVDSSFPPSFDGSFFFSDYYAGVLRVLKKNGAQWQLVPGISATDFGSNYGGVADMRVGPDGAAYYADLSGGEIRKITYTPPSADEFGGFLSAGFVGAIALITAVAVMAFRGRIGRNRRLDGAAGI